MEFTKEELNLIADGLEIWRASFHPDSPLCTRPNLDACAQLDVILLKINPNYIPLEQTLPLSAEDRAKAHKEMAALIAK